MADPVATVEKIVRIGLKIKDAVDTVRQNEEECQEIRRRVLRFSVILSQLQQTGMMNDSPAMSGALEDLEETLERALELVAACQERTTVRRLITAGELSKKLRRVKDDILNKVMLASFAINAQTTIILLTLQANGQPLPQHSEDASVANILHNIHSTENARVTSELNGKAKTLLTGNHALLAPFALRNFSLSELKAAINGGDIIGQGGSCKVYKSVLIDGNVVAIKLFEKSHRFVWSHPHDQFLLASKLQHANIVKVLGSGQEVVYRKNVRKVRSSSMIMRLLKRKKYEAQEEEYAQEVEYFWVEEYVPNGSLDRVIHGSRLDWPSLSRIIEGIAQGIHYLHEQHIVHMDVKPSNILLDYDMNPKISDFGLSYVLNDGDNEVNEYRVVGTFGYLPPEYALHGIISVKIDVYGFGVTLFEIIGSMYKSNLPSFEDTVFKIQFPDGAIKAWSAWQDGQMEELFDPSLFDGSDQLMEMERCTQVGLLCIQDDRVDRPTMADILQILHGEKELPAPKIPAYFKSSDEEESVERSASEYKESVEEWRASPSAPDEYLISLYVLGTLNAVA